MGSKSSYDDTKGADRVWISGPTINAVVNTGTVGDSVANIGFATVNVSNPTIYAVVNTTATSGTATVNINGSATIFAVVNTATAKTLITLPITLSTNSVATLAVPTNANKIYVTNLLINSDATVRVNLLSHDAHLNGNASIGVTLAPLGGWVETGAPNSPTYIGNASGALVITKLDLTGTSSKVSGKVVYYQE